MKTILFRIFFFACITYVCASLIYHYSPRQRAHHPFDPYLQIGNPTFHSPIEKMTNTIRVLCLGGSTTDKASPVGAYPAILRDILQKHYPSAQIEVLNGGRQWYSTKHSLINYVTYCHRWDPDVVIVMHTINDLYRSFSPPNLALGPYNEQWTHYYGPSIQGAKPPESFEAFLWSGFQKRLVNRIPIDYPLDKYSSISMYEQHLRSLVARIQSDGAEVFLVAEPSLYKQEMDEAEQAVLCFGRMFCVTRLSTLREEYPSYRSLARAMAAFNGVVANVAQSTDANFINAADSIPKSLDYFRDDCHYTLNGVTAVATYIAEQLIATKTIDRLLQEPPPPPMPVPNSSAD